MRKHGWEASALSNSNNVVKVLVQEEMKYISSGSCFSHQHFVFFPQILPYIVVFVSSHASVGILAGNFGVFLKKI